MSSHREAPEISKDPVADSTDTYAFVSPDKPDTVTIITNYIPLEDPAGGPNFFEFGDDVLYRINVDNDGDGRPDVLYEFRFKTTVTNPNTFLYNTGPITALDSPNFNRRQTYSVTEVRKNRLPRKLGDNLTSPPCNVGARSTPELRDPGERRDPLRVRRHRGLRRPAARRLLRRPRRGVRPRRAAAVPEPAPDPDARGPGVNALRSFNVHTIAIQIPITRLTRDGSKPSDPMAQQRHDRRVGVSPPAEGARARQRQGRRASDRSSRCRASATRCSTRSSSRWAARTSGTPTARRRQGLRAVRRPARAGEAAARPVSGRVPEPRGASTATGPTCSRSCSPASRAASSPASRTSRGRRRPTCCA